MDISAQFCPSCGVKAQSVEKETVGQKVDRVIDKTKSNSKESPSIAVILVIAIAILAILLLVFAFSGGNGLGNDLVDVTSVGLDHKYFYATTLSGGTSDERPIKGTIKFSFMPKEYFERVTGVGLQNIEITYSDGQKQNAGSGVFDEYYNIYNPHQEYSFSMNYVVDLYPKADDNINAFFKTSHIKADIVINTTDETNKVIGHINHDVVPPSK
ncbi:MAG: hypothetical protein ABS871_02265 [Methanobrevibacter sp.]